MPGRIEGWTGDDSSLLAALDKALSTARSVPPDFVAPARRASSWHGIDAELAQLTHDSAAPQSTTTRAEPVVVRAMTFVGRSFTIELGIGEHALRGQLVPHQAGKLEVQLLDGAERTTDADELGYFSFDRVPTTSFRLYSSTADVAVATWVVL